MNRTCKWILLGAIPGLMFCIIPIPGFELRLSWQLAAIWLGGLAFASLLTSPWRAAFWLLCVAVTARYLPPAYDAYISLVMVAIFLAAAEGFKHLEKGHIETAMRIAAVALLAWIVLQEAGWARTWFAPRNAGPFNPNTGGVILAMCLPLFLAGWWLLLAPVIIWAIVVSQTTTAMIAAAAALLVYAVLALRGYATLPTGRTFRLQAIAVILAGLVGGGVLWSAKVDSLDALPQSERVIAWTVAARSMESEMWGRGLGSWSSVFPFFASGVRRLGDLKETGGQTILTNYFAQAHNEYVQAGFELGIQTVILMAAFLMFVAVSIWLGWVSPAVAAGMAALLVSCCGVFVFHVVSSALIGVAWLAMWEKETEAENGV